MHDKENLYSAIDFWRKNTCVKFVEIESNATVPGSVRFIPVKDNNVFMDAVIGKQVEDEQMVLDNNVFMDAVIGKQVEDEQMVLVPQNGKLHEYIRIIGHLLGLAFQHQRPDGHKFLRYQLQNIQSPHYLPFFEPKDVTTYLPFDYGSMTAVNPKLYGKENKSVLEPTDLRYQETMGQKKPSFFDLYAVNTHYDCIDKLGDGLMIISETNMVPIIASNRLGPDSMTIYEFSYQQIKREDAWNLMRALIKPSAPELEYNMDPPIQHRKAENIPADVDRITESVIPTGKAENEPAIPAKSVKDESTVPAEDAIDKSAAPAAKPVAATEEKEPVLENPKNEDLEAPGPSGLQTFEEYKRNEPFRATSDWKVLYNSSENKQATGLFVIYAVSFD
ncbi:unnamed protein product [Gongylonema pulchrum]|uniref:Metalloendopeptidase n=1 Tax=Gongylonema pulchrum TaxID=637853 RepID=A0A183DZ51_9BILA|nr:unnamed protein product [Gongylonema pulchrum]